MTAHKAKRVKKSNPNTQEPGVHKSILALMGDPKWPRGIEPSGDRYLDMAALQLIMDAQDDTKKLTSLTGWCLKNNIYPKEIENWRDRNETFRKACNFALAHFGERRENELRNGVSSALAFVLPQYRDDYMKERNDRAALKQTIEGKGGTELHVHMTPIESTDMVKPRILVEEKV